MTRQDYTNRLRIGGGTVQYAHKILYVILYTTKTKIQSIVFHFSDSPSSGNEVQRLGEQLVVERVHDEHVAVVHRYRCHWILRKNVNVKIVTNIVDFTVQISF